MTDFCIQLLQNNFSHINFASCNKLYGDIIGKEFSNWGDLERWYKDTLDPLVEIVYSKFKILFLR